MAVVPMFHANSWGVPYSATMTGATQVLTGVRPDPGSICRLINDHRVSISLGVPTIWVGMLDYLSRTEEEFDLSCLRMVISGGSAVPRSMIQAFKERLGVDLVQAYGMTEATPLVSFNRLGSHLDDLEDDDRLTEQGKQGTPVYGIEMRLVDENGVDLDWDGDQRGELLFRGPWIASEYLNDPRSEETFIDGWYHSGDIASLDRWGNIQIGDRVKDMVKSGGEWISSVDLETAIIAHPGVLEAAVIAVPHPTWQERPIACVVPNAEFRDSLEKGEVLDFIRPRFASWWIPDDVIFIDEIPKTSVGKFDKKVLRDRFQDHPTGR
jgi:fatty-acyl-CoA synthase